MNFGLFYWFGYRMARTPRPPPCQTGLDRLLRLAERAEKRGVDIALENLRKLEHLEYAYYVKTALAAAGYRGNVTLEVTNEFSPLYRDATAEQFLAAAYRKAAELFS